MTFQDKIVMDDILELQVDAWNLPIKGDLGQALQASLNHSISFLLIFSLVFFFSFFYHVVLKPLARARGEAFVNL